MAVVKTYDLSGKEVGEVEVADALLDNKTNSQLVKDYLIALRANARQWSANTKTRTEVNHSGQKPHPQKGTGRARQGYLGSTQYKGGGRVGGPRPKFDQHVSMNKKEKKAAVRHLLAEKIEGNQLIVLKSEKLNAPKTKKISEFLKARSLEGRRILFIGDKADENFLLSMRNIDRAEYRQVGVASGYDIVIPYAIIVLDSAINPLIDILKG
jgi:large subunit ribosomal protein L4